MNALLCDLSHFPSLEILIIDFSSMDMHLHRNKEIVLDEVETPEQVLKAEASAPWRALMSRTYFTLAQNKSHHVKYFEIRRLVWKQVSTFNRLGKVITLRTERYRRGTLGTGGGKSHPSCPTFRLDATTKGSGLVVHLCLSRTIRFPPRP